MLMSAKTPGIAVKQWHANFMNRRKQPVEVPALHVNIAIRDSLTNFEDQNYQSSLLFGPGGAMMLPTDPSDAIQPLDEGQASLTPITASATSAFQLHFQSPTLDANTDLFTQPNTIASAALIGVTASMPLPTSLTQPSSSSPSSQAQYQSSTSSVLLAGSLAMSISSRTFMGMTTATSTSSPFTPSTASPNPTSASSTSVSQRDPESLPRLAEIVIGVVAAVSLIAFLSTLGSWYYKQRQRKHEDADIISLASFHSGPSKGFFGCFKKRREIHRDDISELGFGLGHVTFFGDPNSGDEHHRVGLTIGPENVIREDKNDETGFASQNPFSDRFGIGPIDGGYLLPAHGNASSAATSSPYQHLAPAKPLGGSSVVPLTVANSAPGDTSGDEEWQNKVGPAPPPPVRHPSVGTPQIGVSDPRFMGVIEDGALAVPWGPLAIRRNGPQPPNEIYDTRTDNDTEMLWNRDLGFKPLELSHAPTLYAGSSRTFSQRLDLSLSKPTDWRDGATNPPAGTFRAARDAEMNAKSAEPTSMSSGNWATTLKNNFYNALNAVGGSIHANNNSNRSADPEAAISNRPTPNLLTSNHSTQSRRSSIPFPSHDDVQTLRDPLEDILTPPPARVATVRLGRTKGSILRSNLGIPPSGKPEHGTGLGLGIDALSRSSTLSTCWSDAEDEDSNEENVQKVRIRARRSNGCALLAQLRRTETSSSASSSGARPLSRDLRASRGIHKTRGKSLKAPSKRPRYSRMPVSQSSTASYASTSAGEERL
ncbi:hypothetical protein K439DRAFT_779175 [Ramaria rubella]|nr:hypothetical protein K439DRAFT_779175 [Ramaria rubella]